MGILVNQNWRIRLGSQTAAITHARAALGRDEAASDEAEAALNIKE
jgi:hypothetical protein